jgi:hypothetical protein
VTGPLARTVLATSLACACSCASVLGVDKTYELAEAGTADGAATGTDASGPTVFRCSAGAAPCATPENECCLSDNATTLACVSATPADPCPNGTDIHCAQPADCTTAAPVCCVSLDNESDILSATCRTACQAGETATCTPGAPCASGQCSALEVRPAPPLQNPWFYACQ